MNLVVYYIIIRGLVDEFMHIWVPQPGWLSRPIGELADGREGS